MNTSPINHTNTRNENKSRPSLIAKCPATGEVLAEIPVSSAAQVRQARSELKEAGKVWKNTPLRKRIRLLRRFQGVLVDSLDEITTAITLDCGKTRQDALIEVFITVDVLGRHLSKAPAWLENKRIPTGLYMFKRAYVEQRPYGVVAVIGPWNYPFTLVLQPMLTALLAGNTVMMKPSEETSYVGQMIESLFARVPELAPYVRILYGAGEVGAAMVDAQPDLIFLTGSTATGEKVAVAAAKHLIPVISELGGKDPMIVLEDADLEAAARWGVWGACFNAGQTCMAVERIYVLDAVHDAFVEHAVRFASEFQMGFTTDTNAPYSMGPLTTERQTTIVARHLQDALDKGAKLLVGGEMKGQFMEPTVLTDVDDSMLILQEETFGPIVPIVRVQDEEEALRRANDCAYGLGASVWSEDIAHAQKLLSRVESGTLQVNDTLSHFAIPTLPFGGVKRSGVGRVHGREDLLQFTQSYSYVVAKPPSSLDIATRMREPGNYALGKAMIQTVFGVTLQQRSQPIRDLIGSERLGKVKTASKSAAMGAVALASVFFIARNARKASN